MKKADERYASIDLMLADLMRARTEVAVHAEQERQAEAKERSHAAVAGAAGAAAGAATGIRMSRRAEATKELREAKERAEEQMRQKQSIQEYHMNQLALSRAMARLRVTSHKEI